MGLLLLGTVPLCRSVRHMALAANIALAAIWIAAWQVECAAQWTIDDAPIHYRDTRGENSVTELFTQVDAGEVSLQYDREFGYLPALLRAWEIPISSQSLVFSKTSLQSRRISADNPRAIYFNDEIYVGWVRGSSLLEISTADPHLGAAFYTIRMQPERAVFRRENDRCLACHRLPMTQDVPGHAVRSVLTRRSGTINSLRRSYITDHKSPISERWGGWYVTGDLGQMEHMGNAFLEDERLVPSGKPNRRDVRNDIDSSKWLSPYSDVVALMVLEHQTQMHNTFTSADFAVRRAIHEESTVPPFGEQSEAVDQGESRPLEALVDDSAKRIVDDMLFTGEAELASAIEGSSSFTSDFAQRGPHADDGRSLRELDLKTRLFRFPCSYLIYSSAFDSLAEPLRGRVYRRLWNVLTHRDRSPEYSHLSRRTRASILKILRQTKQDLPRYWTGS